MDFAELVRFGVVLAALGAMAAVVVALVHWGQKRRALESFSESVRWVVVGLVVAFVANMVQATDATGSIVGMVLGVITLTLSEYWLKSAEGDVDELESLEDTPAET